MKKILGLLLGAYCWINVLSVSAAEKFEVLPDLPEPLAAAQASSVSTTDSNTLDLASQSVGQQIDPLSVIISLALVILLIYASGIIYSKLNKFGFRLMKNQVRDIDDSRVTVISTTPLGSNKTLHVVELDGKRMLLGASTNSIELIKDLGTYPPVNTDNLEYSKIEIPNIRIPKIEIPKIEFPNIGFTKASKKHNYEKESSDNTNKQTQNEDNNEFVISEIYEESSDGIIDKLFTQPEENKNESYDNTDEREDNVQKNMHTIDPEEYALYKKYL